MATPPIGEDLSSAAKGPARNWMRAAAPGIAFRFSARTSLPRSAETVASEQRTRSIHLRRLGRNLYHIARGTQAVSSFGARRLHPREGAARAVAAACGMGPNRARRARGQAVAVGGHASGRAPAGPGAATPTCWCSPAPPGARSRSAPATSTVRRMPGDPRQRGDHRAPRHALPIPARGRRPATSSWSSAPTAARVTSASAARTWPTIATCASPRDTRRADAHARDVLSVRRAQSRRAAALRGGRRGGLGEQAHAINLR